MFVDILGSLEGIHEIKKICEKYNLPLIEDGIRCRNIADITCFSFHSRKLLTIGEGGSITFNNDDYVNFFNIKLNHGEKIENSKFDFVDYRYNYRLSELQYVMGIKHVQKLNTIVELRNSIRNEYIEKFDLLDFKAQTISDKVVFNVQSLVFKVPENISRDEFVISLKENGIEITLGISYYKKKYNDVQENALFLEQNTITFLCYESVDITYIVDKVEQYQ